MLNRAHTSMASAQGLPWTSGQGTIEYLVIIAIVVVISLVVVALTTNMLGSPSTQISSSTDKIGNLTSGGITVVESVTDSQGDSVIRLQNNSGENITLTKITSGGIENDYSQTIPQGEKISLGIDSLDLGCPCVEGQSSVSCDYTITFVSSSGLTKILSRTTRIECVTNVVPVGTVIPPTATTGTIDCWNESENIHPICTLSDLNRVREHLDWNYELKASIDASQTTTWNSGAGFEPIGLGSSFSGSFNGNNKTISGLYIYLPNTDNVGLFSQVSGVNVALTDIVLTDVNVNGYNYTGGLVGLKSGGSISGTNVSGVVTGTYFFASLLVGGHKGGSISDSHTEGSVIGNSRVGGIVGYQDQTSGSSSISNSYSTASVSGERTGGLVGWQQGGIITRCYATGSVTGGNYTGGLVGYQSSSSVINNSYSTGNVLSVGGIDVGGLVGYQGSSSINSNSYSTGNVSGSIEVGGLVGLSYGAILNSYSTGLVTGTSSVGGLVGNRGSGPNSFVTNCYWDINRTGKTLCCGSGTCTNCFGKNLASDETDAFFPKSALSGDYNVPMQHNILDANNWTFGIDANWVARDGNYPILSWQ